MDCHNCGACCKYVLQNTNLPPTELDKLRNMQKFYNVMFIPCACKHFDKTTKTCLIYNDRPDACKNFKVGGLTCLLCRKADGIK